MLRNYAILLFALLAFLSCNKNPLGEDELGNRGVGDPEFFTTSIDSFETSFIAQPQGKSLNLVLGRNPEYESRILLNFLYPDTISEEFQDIRITLYKRKFSKDDTIEFNLHIVTSSWSEDYATWDMADQSIRWNQAGGDYEPTPILTKSNTGDSVVIRFTRDQLLALKNGAGIILIPTRSGFTTFYSREGGKSLRFTYKKGDDRYDIPLSGDAHIIKTHLALPPYGKVWIGGGFPFRVFFYLPTDTALINKKIIYSQLQMNKLFAFSLRDTVEVVARALTEPYRGFDTKFTSILNSGKFTSADSQYKMDIVNIIQRIAHRPDSNFGFFLTINPENYDISRFEIRPESVQIEIGYLNPPGIRR